MWSLDIIYNKKDPENNNQSHLIFFLIEFTPCKVIKRLRHKGFLDVEELENRKYQEGARTIERVIEKTGDNICFYILS